MADTLQKEWPFKIGSDSYRAVVGLPQGNPARYRIEFFKTGRKRPCLVKNVQAGLGEAFVENDQIIEKAVSDGKRDIQRQVQAAAANKTSKRTPGNSAPRKRRKTGK